MVEPTESESKEEMDRFCDALVAILKEAQSVPALVVNAPYTAAEVVGEWAHEFSREQAVYPLEWVRVQKFFPHVTKIDNGYGDRNLVAVNEE
jgi:glycine dehydrogenase